MEVHLRQALAPELRTLVSQRLQEIDPAALVDLDRLTGHLRLNTLASSQELQQILTAIDPALADAELHYVRSGCCGGCGG